jgi:hypothetical protein
LALPRKRHLSPQTVQQDGNFRFYNVQKQTHISRSSLRSALYKNIQQIKQYKQRDARRLFNRSILNLKGTRRGFTKTTGKPLSYHCRAFYALQKERCGAPTESFTSHVLQSFFRPRAKLLKRLSKQAQYHQNKLRRRKLAAGTRLQREAEQQRGAVAGAPAVRVISRFLQQAPTTTPPAPIFFNRPLYNLLRVQATSTQGARNVEEISLENFRATLQYASSLERLIPELISFFIIKHIKNEDSSFARIKKLISVTY